jgi:hypothetical protein
VEVTYLPAFDHCYNQPDWSLIATVAAYQPEHLHGRLGLEWCNEIAVPLTWANHSRMSKKGSSSPYLRLSWPSEGSTFQTSVVSTIIGLISSLRCEGLATARHHFCTVTLAHLLLLQRIANLKHESRKSYYRSLVHLNQCVTGQYQG